jgi:sugar phosphate isomerase/epimerase
MNRRTFLGTAAGAALAQAHPQTGTPVRLGIDLFSIRSSGWTPIEYLNYSAKHGARVVHFSEIRFIGSLEPENLKQVRARSEELGIEVELGMRSICPTSKTFDASQGTGEQQLERAVVAAKTVGSPIVRCFLGTFQDRMGAEPIDFHIANTVKVLKAVRSKIVDAGLKVAVENHAGDMQARELKMLIEEAGKDYVGACLDSGNPLWAIEDPHVTLETLAPYVLTSHVRDSAVWRVPEGAAVAWTRMGEGNVGIDEWVRKYQQLCPGKALSMEIIVIGARKYPYFDPKFWDAYRNTPAHEFSRFVAIADKGTPREMPTVPKEKQAQQERADLEASIVYTKKLLGIA